MHRRINLRLGDSIHICGQDYQLTRNIGALRGFQFRTYLVKSGLDGKEYLAKVTQDLKRALVEVRAHIHLKNKRYPDRYYAKMIAFDHEAVVVRSQSQLRGKFAAILLAYLPPERFQPLDQYLQSKSAITVAPSVRKKLGGKLSRRISKLHELAISHGDLRPANIMVTVGRGGRTGVRVIDFGLSRFGDNQAIERDDRRLERVMHRIAAGK